MRKIIPLLLLAFCQKTFGQKSDNSFIRIGDTLPNMVFIGVDKYKEGILKLTDFKGKKIIFDFWNRWCSSCIALFPKIEDLQNKYSEQVVFITVTNDSRSDYELIKKRSRTVSDMKLPVIIEDSLLNQLIPHQGVPFYAWFTEGGELVGTSRSSQINETNINRFISNQFKSLSNSLSVDTFNLISDYLTIKEKKLKGEIYYSGFKKHYRKIFIREDQEYKNLNSSELKTAFFLNTNIASLFETAYDVNMRDILPMDKKLNYILEPVDSKKGIEEWREKTSYSYILRGRKAMPWGSGFDFYPFLRQDLLETFKIKAEKRKITRDVYVLKKLNDFKFSKFSNNTNIGYTQSDNTNSGIFLTNSTSRDLAFSIEKKLNLHNAPYQYIKVIDETSYTGKLSLELLCLPNIESINKALKNYGLIIEITKRDVESLLLYKQ